MVFNLPPLDYPYLAHLFIISITYFITWGYIIFSKTSFLIDDQDGLERFNDRWDGEKVINTYEHDENGIKTSYNNISYNPRVGLPGSVIRWLRLNLGKKFTVIGKNSKGHEVFGYVQSPRRHHAISFIVHFANVILTYFFLARIFDPTLAFLSTLLFVVHPVTCQAVAWISGIGYLQCLFFALVSFHIALSNPNPYLLMPGVFFSSLLSAWGLFSGAFNFIPLLLIGKFEAGIIASLILFVAFFQFGKGFVTRRVSEFKKQNMARSTFLNPRKPIVMIKTLWYYLRLVIFPKRLGLFHSWGYHYDEKLERIDGLFWKGLLSLVILISLAILGPYAVTFGIVWFITYLLVFSNFMTAMQFVVDRYVFISSLGFCIVASYYLQDYPVIFSFVLGIFLMRTLVHLPTFKNLVSFYKSNIENFPDSEVAYGNLGVTLHHEGKTGSAMDHWTESAKINPYYDVPHYNMYQVYRMSGMLQQAKDELNKCLNSKTVHFPEMWSKEMEGLEKTMAIQSRKNEINNEINKYFAEGNFEKMSELKKEMENLK